MASKDCVMTLGLPLTDTGLLFRRRVAQEKDSTGVISGMVVVTE